MKTKKIFPIIFLVLISVIAPAAEDQLITTGIGPTSREALMAAQRKAVEQGIGVLVDSQSLAENLMLVEDKILSRSRGYVKHYTVISEKKLDDGTWEVVIECQVAVDKLKNSLNAIGILRDKMGNPRIMVIYDLAVPGEIDSSDEPAAVEAYDGIIQYLAEREFPVVEKREVEQQEPQEFTSPEKYYEKYAQLGLSKEAEYLLVYTVKPYAQEAADIFKRGWVMISAKIINTSSGQILASQSQKVMAVDKESIEFAIRKAGRKAGELVAKFLEDKLLKRWQNETVSGRTVVLELTNIDDFSLLVEFKAELKKAFGVRNIVQRNSTSSTSEYEITYVGDIDTLKENAYKILEKMGLKANAPTSAGDRIKIKLVKTLKKSKSKGNY